MEQGRGGNKGGGLMRMVREDQLFTKCTEL